MLKSVMDTTYARHDSHLINWVPYEANTSIVNTTVTTNVSNDTIPYLNDWGPKRDPLYIVIPITIIYTTIFIVGVIGNISTCIVIAKNKCMQTATNYYLFSLAVSDLLLVVSGLPTEIYSVWSKYPYIFGEPFCIAQGFAAETSANATVLTITAFTVERYVAICHPFLSHTMSKLSRAIKFVMVIWLIASLLAIPQAVSLGIVTYTPAGGVVNKDHRVCTVKRTIIPYNFEISTMLFFVAPMSMITVLYILIGIQLYGTKTVRPSRSNSIKMKHRINKPSVAFASNTAQGVLILNGENLESDTQEEEGRKNFSKNAQATKHVVKMLVAVVVAFFICWAPFHVQRLLAIYGHRRNTENMVTTFRVITYLSGILYFLSTTINPLLYHIMSHRFREAFKETFKRFFRRKSRTPGNKCYSTLSGRSSQINSHSNTDSCSRRSSLRYLDTEIARISSSKRPVVVSFKKTKPQIVKTKEVGLDVNLQDALDSLQNPRPVYTPTNNKNRNKVYYPDNKNGVPVGSCSFIAMPNVEPSHKCSMPQPRIEDIEIFREEHLRIYKRRRKDRKCKYEFISKSCTMPQIVYPNPEFADCQMKSDSVWGFGDEIDKTRSCSELISESNEKDKLKLNDGVMLHVP